jgi:hypothetical protein
MAEQGGQKAGHIVEQELRRQAARIFPKLINEAGYIQPIRNITGENEFLYGLFTRRNQYSRSVQMIAEPVIQGFKRLSWISETDNRFILTDEGLLWLRRHRAGAEPFLEQHQLRETSFREINSSKRPVVVNEGESPLGWLRRRKDRNGTPLINAQQYEAGERLRSEFELAQMTPSVTSKWEGAAPSKRMRRAAPEGAAGLSDQALASRQRVLRALEAVGPELAGVLIDVCCHLLGLTGAEKSRGWPQRSGKVILQIALTSLARHYGILSETNAADQVKTRLNHWGMEGFRPSLDQWR